MNEWQEMLEQFRRHPLTDEQEIQRLRLLHDKANKQLREVESDKEQDQIESAKGRVAFFDRLTIGAGAAITALVSFLGAHSTKLHPAWILRAALISLVLTMIAGLFRNYRYPNYVMKIHQVSWTRCSRYEQECRVNYLKADQTTVNVRTGQTIDIDEVSKNFEQSNKELEELSQKADKEAKRLERHWKYAQNLCISFAALAMVCLVWLALANF
jgi:hypothetical protein